MTDKDRKEAERMAWQHLDIAQHDDRSFESFIAGYAAACEAKLEYLCEQLNKQAALSFELGKSYEIARSAKLIAVMKDTFCHRDPDMIKFLLDEAIVEANRD